MSWTHLFDPINTSIQFAAWAGAAVYLAFRRSFGWSVVLTVFFVTQLGAFYLTIPLANRFGLAMQLAFTAFCIGALGFLIGGAIFSLLQNLHDDPQGTVTWAWRLWRGGVGPKDGGTP